jgi:nicotinate-nucleotide adenylyltransferase
VRLGIYGGSFDPPHVGHLLTASDAFEALDLDRLVWVPAAVQPLKAGQALATPAQRLEMVRLLLEDDPRFEVDPVEIDRDGLSFTVDTVAAYAERYPNAERFLLVGADVLTSFDRWREPERIRQLATLAVLERAVEGPMDGPPFGDGLLRLATRRVDVSSTEIRARLRDGRSIHGFVPASVERFITTERLYR